VKKVKRIKKLWNENRILFVLFVILIVCFIAICGVVMSYFVGDKKSVYGIDIGTGASCIYPLLGTKLYKWHFIASDINPESIQHALNNININKMSDYIECKLVQKETILNSLLKKKMLNCFVQSELIH